MLDNRVEVVTTGIDEALQLIGGDAFGHINSVGLRIPTLATNLAAAAAAPPNPLTGLPTFPGPLVGRYLFLLCTFSIPMGGCARIRGWRQLLTLGYKQEQDDSSNAPRYVEQLVSSPFFKLPDGNVSWHLMDVGPPNAQGVNPLRSGPNDLDNFKFRWSGDSALLYETATLPPGDPFYVDLTAYQPPNQGRPWGIPLFPGFGTMYDLRTPWRDGAGGVAWHSLDVPLQGPRTIALFASIRQSNPETRPTLNVPDPFFPNGLSEEEQFLQNFPNAIYWRVGGSLIVDV